MTQHSGTRLPWHLLPDNAAVGDGGRLTIGGCDTIELAREFGTPLFVYDEEHLRARCREAVAAFGSAATYATKAFLCRAMAKVAAEEGMGLDVASGGEMHVCLSAGVPPSAWSSTATTSRSASCARPERRASVGPWSTASTSWPGWRPSTARTAASPTGTAPHHPRGEGRDP